MGPEVPDNASSYQPFRHPNRWPAEHLLPAASFKELLLHYRDRLIALSRTLLEILARGLPYNNPRLFDAFATDPLAVVRLLHYPPQPDLTDPQQVGAGAHTDFGAITLLLQDGQGGLQVLNEATGVWVNVPPNPEAYVVNIGDMMAMWTRKYHSNIHRVINSSGGERYSVPFFFDGNLEYVLRPLDGDGTEQGVTVEEFMAERYRKTHPGSYK